MPGSHIYVFRPSSYWILKNIERDENIGVFAASTHFDLWLRSYWVPTGSFLGSYDVVNVYTRFLFMFSSRHSRSYCVTVSACCIFNMFMPFAPRFILRIWHVLHKKYKIKHCTLYCNLLLCWNSFPCFSVSSYKTSQFAGISLCVLVAEILAEAARILISRVMWAFFYKYAVTLL